MPSSISSSNSLGTTDVHLRHVPAISGQRIAILATLIMVVSVGIWEFGQRQAGMRTDDLDDGVAHWAVERHKIDANTAIAVIGSSRMLFDTDLDIWQEVTGERPIQLALEGTSPRIFFEDLADDEDFNGLLVVGITPGLYVAYRGGLYEAGLERHRKGTPSQVFGHAIQMELEPYFAFLDFDRSLFKMIERSWILPERDGVMGPLFDVWKIQWNGEDRQTNAWERLSRDEYLRQHAINTWMAFPKPPAPNDQAMAEIIAETAGYVKKIRARGGEVVFVRAPSAGKVREGEKVGAPRDRIWDRLVNETGVIGIHFEDYRELSEDMVVIEWSHLEKPSAQRFSRALAHIVQEKLAEQGYIIGGDRE